MCVYSRCLGAGIVENKSLRRKTNCCIRSFESFGIRELVFGFGTVDKNQCSVDELERFGYIQTEMTNSAKTLMGGQSTLNTFPNSFFCLTFLRLTQFSILEFFQIYWLHLVCHKLSIDLSINNCFIRLNALNRIHTPERLKVRTSMHRNCHIMQ